MGAKSSLSEVETVLRDNASTPQLELLVSAGCNRQSLLSLLTLAFWTDESWKPLTGSDLRGFKASLRQIRHCAKLIDRLNRSDLLYHVSFELHHPYFVGVHRSPTLPERLDEYAKAVEFLQRTFGPKRKLRMHVWKAGLVATVLLQTGKLHDPEVSALVSAVLNDPKYTEKAHQAWRRRYSWIIENDSYEGRLPHPSPSPYLRTIFCLHKWCARMQVFGIVHS